MFNSISIIRPVRETPNDRNTVRAIRERWAPKEAYATLGLSTSPKQGRIEKEGVEIVEVEENIILNRSRKKQRNIINSDAKT